MAPDGTATTHRLPTLAGEDAFRAWLRDRCAATSLNQVAAGAGISHSYLSNVLAGRKPLTPVFVAKFGYARREHVTFEPVE